MADDRLDALLADMAVDFPPTPHLAEAVRVRLTAGRTRSRPVLRVGRAAALALMGLLLLAGLAVAGAIGVGPMRIIFGQALPSPNVPPLATRLALGERLSLDQLEPRTDLDLVAPRAIGEPDEAYLLPSGIVSLVWGADDELPAMDASGIGLLEMLIPGDLEPSLVEKVVSEFDTTLERVQVDGRQGWWISGAPHVLRYVTPGGSDSGIRSRLVDAALVWQAADGTVVRIESGLGRDASVSLGESLAPLR